MYIFTTEIFDCMKTFNIERDDIYTLFHNPDRNHSYEYETMRGTLYFKFLSERSYYLLGDYNETENKAFFVFIVYPDLLETEILDLTLIDLLRLFANRFGVELGFHNERSKFIEYSRYNAKSRQEAMNIINLPLKQFEEEVNIKSYGKYHIQGAKGSFSSAISLSFALNLDLYLKWLGDHRK